jgi:L-lysine 2,3-aminomutase
LDEQRYTHDSAGFELGWLTAATAGVAAHSRVGFYDREQNGMGWLNRKRGAVEQRDDAHVLFFKPLGVVADGSGICLHLFKSLRLHEVKELTVVVEILHLNVDHVRRLEGIAGFKGALNNAAGLQVSDFYAIERLALARFHKLIFDDGSRVAIEHHFEAGLEFVRAVRRHNTPLSLNRCLAPLVSARWFIDGEGKPSTLRVSSFTWGKIERAMIPGTQPLMQPPPWQRELARAITDPTELVRVLGLDPALIEPARMAGRRFMLRVPRGYVARMRHGDPSDPLLRQVLPLAQEDEPTSGFVADPVGDLAAMLVPGVLHKYAGRVLLTATGACAIHCRYCFRRHFPYAQANAGAEAWRDAIAAVAADSSIREVIVSGGDPLTLADSRLRALIGPIADIPHVERLRVHTRLPIVLPERITPELCQLLAGTRLQAVVVVHANHANEIDAGVSAALHGLRAAGVTLLNQSVLLRGVNDNVEALCRLSEALFGAGVLPYYLHLLDKVDGAAHFDVSDAEARQLWEAMAARLPGYLVPRLVREEPGAPYKSPR